jgi:hypothetical protein
MLSSPQQLITKRTGDWWQDDRRNWCAYCGIAISNDPKGKARKFTKDHVLSRRHGNRQVTIPACQQCNTKKGKLPLSEFLLSTDFEQERAKKRPQRWHLRDLWLVMALASVEQARSLENDWPVD